MLKSIFKIISFYDEVRWSSGVNYNLINYFKNTIDDDTKLLTHWLCYITDRQMPFERIWDIGGFVFSDLIDTIKKKNTLELLDPENEISFIKRKNDGFVFTSLSKVNENKILNNMIF